MLRRCAITRPSTALTSASALSSHAAASSMLATAAVASLFTSTSQTMRHGRLKSYPRSSRPRQDRPLGTVTHRHIRRSRPRAGTPAGGDVMDGRQHST